ncbi:MAG: hypothetical protein H5T99_10915, partial [Moorella sp. (in: Bacteria)]|nr:hypothetical protein [Moorella sp. (in: firmicutes)]
IFADIVPPVLGVAARPAAARTPSTAADWKGVFFVVLAFILGGGAFLLISAGSWEKALTRLKQFTSIEWVNLLGLQFVRQPALKKEVKEKLEGSSDRDTVRLIHNSARESQPNNQRADWQKD